MKLLIVESPGKLKKLSGFLGRDWRVEATLGHVRDLPPKEIGIDVSNGFRPSYSIIKGKENAVKRLKASIAASDEVYLATDPDREGEAISWHVQELCKKELKGKIVHRVTFNSITRETVLKAIESPRKVDSALVDAQQARRLVDRLLGYSVSPMASRFLSVPGLSAGRVQSVCLRLVVDREWEIANFVVSKFWNVDVSFPVGSGFVARAWVRSPGSEKAVEDLSVEVRDRLLTQLSWSTFHVDKVQRGSKARRPHPPFTTSSLQQAASKGLEMSPDHTMEVAQRLYEAGYITYMRTDSTMVAPEAQDEALAWITETHGLKYVPAVRQRFESPSANAQEAHEAIRPAHVQESSELVGGVVGEDAGRLYDLIWRRFVASQMADARFDQVQARILASGASDVELRASGRVMTFEGFLAVYDEPMDVDDVDKSGAGMLPDSLVDGLILPVGQVAASEHSTKPPGRYSEASLIQKLEREGIGRPSTYASMVGVVRERGYVKIKERRLLPTESGMALCGFLVGYFSTMFAYDFTVDLERGLDEVARGKADWRTIVAKVYDPLLVCIASADREVAAKREAHIRENSTGQACPSCGSPLMNKTGKFGPFVGCSTYPKCEYVVRRDVARSTTGKAVS